MRGIRRYMTTQEPASLVKLLRTTTLKYPDQPAFTFKTNTYTWSEVFDRTQRLATYLQEQGVVRGDRVAIKGKNSINYVESIFACSMIGAAIVTISYRLSNIEIANQLSLVEPRFILETFTDEMYANKAPIAELGCEDDVYSISCTSGSTGHPKGVVLTQKNQYNNAIASVEMYDLDRHDITLVGGPLYHIGPQNRIFATAYLGSHCIILEKFEVEEFLEAIEKYKVTNISLAPTMYHMLLTNPSIKKYDLSNITRVQAFGSPISKSTRDLIKYFFGNADFYDSHGMTESTGAVVVNGKIPSHVQAKIVDGELAVKSPCVMRGYWKNPELTDEVLKDGWYYTGDGFAEVNGKFIFKGRTKEMIISGGVNIYPNEIEQVLCTHPLVQQAAVVGRKDVVWGELPHAFVVGTASEEALIRLCRDHLGSYKCPRYFTFVNEIPTTGIGKPDKKRLTLLSNSV